MFDDGRRTHLPGQPPASGIACEDLRIGTRLRRSRGTLLEICDRLGDDLVLKVWIPPGGWVYRLEAAEMVRWAIEHGLYTVEDPSEGTDG